ncbi:MAG: 1,4-alpha-glucan branching protein GlgB [Phycisphaerae bacterium]|nr:1,4-alpha-glucan branching protein GlgB [Phycisphaerae bacterium]
MSKRTSIVDTVDQPPTSRNSLLTEDDIYLFNEGRHFDLYNKLGAHVVESGGRSLTHFGVWAPNAREVSVIGPFNDWTPGRHPLQPRGSSGIWEGGFENVSPGCIYKYHISSHQRGYSVAKADPFARCTELPPGTASVVWNGGHTWQDGDWMERRASQNILADPISVYEMHLGSWRRNSSTRQFLSYREVADPLVDYLQRAGFTHVEFLPLMEHPFFGSWGYQTSAYFAPTRRFGEPEDLMYLIDRLHQAGIGVILDWVPSHFPTDEHGLGYFDGTHLYEHADPRRGFHRDWNTLIFNYGRNEVRSFLVSSAMYWLDKFHADGLRVDAVASMLYLDYSRSEGEWIPNKYGGREDLEAVDFLRQLNETVYARYPGVQTTAEESTSWPGVSRPTYLGGLGFGFKWDMGWMHDTLQYMSRNPVYRKYHHDKLTFRNVYASSENFVLPLSHDEVVHGKGSLLGKMPGDDWQRFGNLRLLLGSMYATTGKKLLFMGAELGQWSEWNHDAELDWNLLEFPFHEGMLRWVSDLNAAYRREPALHDGDCRPDGFEWIDADDSQQSVLTYLRRGNGPRDTILVAVNFTPVPRENYRIGVPASGYWQEILNSDAAFYGGSGMGNYGGVQAVPVAWHNRPLSVKITVPPLAIVMFKCPPEIVT